MGRKFLVIYQPDDFIEDIHIVIARDADQAISEVMTHRHVRLDFRAYDLDQLPDGWSYFCTMEKYGGKHA